MRSEEALGVDKGNLREQGGRHLLGKVGYTAVYFPSKNLSRFTQGLCVSLYIGISTFKHVQLDKSSIVKTGKVGGANGASQSCCHEVEQDFWLK